MRATLNQAIKDFLHADVSQKSANTYANYQRYLQHFSKYCSDIPLDQLTHQKLINYRNYLENQTELSPISQNYHLTALRQFIDYLHRARLTELSSQDIKLHTLSHQTTTMPNLSQQDRLPPPITDNLRDQLIINLISTTGLKVSEVIALDREDIFPNLRQITAGSPPKTRVLTLEPSTSLLLEKYLNSRHDTIPALFIRQKTHASTSFRLTSRTVQRIIHNNLTFTATPSSLRHQFAKQLFDHGVSTDEAGNILGHTNKTSTSRYRQRLTQHS